MNCEFFGCFPFFVANTITLSMVFLISTFSFYVIFFRYFRVFFL